MNKRLEQITDNLIKIASGDFNFKYQTSEKQDKIDAIGIGLEMVADQLKEVTVSKEKLQKNEEKYRALFENSGTIILTLDPTTSKVIDYNEYSRNFYGLTKKEMDELYISDISIIDKTSCKKFYDVEEGKSYKFETKHKTKYGEKCLLVNAKCYKENGEFRMNAIMFDITEQKITEQKIIENEEKYRSLFENSVAIILVTDPLTSKVISYNKFARKFYGYSVEEMDGLYLKDINSKENLVLLRERLSSLKDGDTLKFETKHKTKYGNKNLLVNAKCYKENDEIRMNTIMFDITEQKITEQKIIENEKKYRSLFENSVAIVLVADSLTSKVISYNKFARKFYGYSVEEMDGLYLKDINLKENLVLLRERLSSLKDGDTIEFEIKHKTSYGIKDLSVNMRCFYDGDRNLAHIIMHDITYRNENEQLLVQARKNRALAMINAEESERKRISFELHDGIGQNLTAIKLMLATIKKNKNLPEKENELILEAKSTIEETITEVRTISQNIVPSVLEDYGLGAALMKMIERIKSVSNTKVGVLIDPNLPEIGVDKSLILYRITQESVNNAIKYSKCKALNIIVVGFSDKIQLTIKDDGIGFSKLETNNNGMGLPHIEERCRILNGQLTINTNLNEGTEIIVEIPTV